MTMVSLAQAELQRQVKKEHFERNVAQAGDALELLEFAAGCVLVAGALRSAISSCA